MANFEQVVLAKNQPKHLTASEKQQPMLVVEDFFQHYDLDIFREMFWQWLVTALSSDVTEFPRGIDRSNLLSMYEKIMKLTEASFQLLEQHENALLNKSV